MTIPAEWLGLCTVHGCVTQQMAFESSAKKYSRAMFSPIFCIHDSEITFWSNFELASQKNV